MTGSEICGKRVLSVMSEKCGILGNPGIHGVSGVTNDKNVYNGWNP